MQSPVLERTIELEGCGNFRDLGGYETVDGRRTCWRRLFRSDSLHWLTDADYEALADQRVSIATGYDLRTTREVERTGSGLMAERGVRHHHLPFIVNLPGDMSEADVRERLKALALTTGQLQSDVFHELFQQAGPCIAELFEQLADEANYPAVFYCAAGKDRTGMVAAIVLRALGVVDEQIVEDFAATLPITQERFEERLRVLEWPNERRNYDPALFKASASTMEHFLAEFDRTYGSVEEYLFTQGVSCETIARVRELLLED